MHHLTYVSSATLPFTDLDLVDLLMRSRRSNHAKGITGMLLCKDGNFMQCLEGERAAIDELYVRIRGDARHRGCIVLASGPLAERRFHDWSMGFRKLDDPQLRELDGYDEFMNLPLTVQAYQDDGSRCMKLLAMFRRNMR
jgi:hypothetical protein